MLIVGGGEVALKKLHSIVQFTKQCTVISPTVIEAVRDLIDSYSLEYLPRVYERGDASGFSLAVVAVSDLDRQKLIGEDVKKCGALCCLVDFPHESDFIFPALIHDGELTVAISTNGASCSFAKRLKEEIEKIIPKTSNLFLDNMKKVRIQLPKGKERQEILRKKVADFFASGGKNY
ncbi:MAG: bifunctional precorrin-2 dehydrogenase/sirohydrochlorin ferrochelatase [Deltaproteobacteria bacterium]|nr:bifunctional precorrin-2 dehydrogenase/sirohydrochlorin ferrochelatase [Deltaproteobacteria bacterium]